MSAYPIHEYCPLCGAHQFEWYEGEASEETILDQEDRIEELYKKLEQLKSKKGGK